ncbi:hypothetical protein LJC56_04510 [Christensenellaceae bacterium OttesenSCG-928-K19]|nr:hypothetical protein [Christensenellaceae bacterium OttesenSCG-928-K19]
MATFLSDKRIIALLTHEGRPVPLPELLSMAQLPVSESGIFLARLDSLVSTGRLVCEAGPDGTPCFAPAQSDSSSPRPATDKNAKHLRRITILAFIGAATGLASLIWQIVNSIS